MVAKILAFLVAPFLFVGANLLVWVVAPARTLLAGRLREPLAAGDRVEVVESLSVTVLTHWNAPYTGGFQCTLPVGTRLAAHEASAVGARGATFVPSDAEAFDRDHVPEEAATSEKYAGVSIPLTPRQLRRHTRRIEPDP